MEKGLANHRNKRCLNCGAGLKSGMRFCPTCGQENRPRVIPFSLLFREWLDDYFSFDSRFFKSVFSLLLRPGFLTKEYNAGRRIQYMPPLRMYIVSSLIYFSLLSLGFFTRPSGTPMTNVSLSTDSTFSLTLNDTKIEFSNKEAFKRKIGTQGMEAFLDSLQVERGTFKRFFTQQLIRNALGDSDDLFSRFRSNASVMVFFLMPVMALLLMLLFRSRKMYFMEHLIFSFHLHSLFFLLLTLFMIIGWVFSFDLSPLAVLFVLVYGFIALKRVYAGRRWLLAARFVSLFLSYSLIICIFVALTFIISIISV